MRKYNINKNKYLKFVLESVFILAIVLFGIIIVSLFKHKSILSMLPALIGGFIGTLTGKIIFDKLHKRKT